MLATFLVVSTPTLIELQGAWSVDIANGTSLPLRAQRAGRTPLVLRDVALELGTTSGGKNEALRAQGIGFTAVLGRWNKELRAELRGSVALASSENGGASLSGRLCEKGKPIRCTLPSACTGRSFFLEHVADADGCVPLRVETSVTPEGQLRTAVSVGDTAAQPPDGIYARLEISLGSTPSEMLVGFGNQPSYLDLKNQTFAIAAQENGVGRGDQPMSRLLDLVAPENAGTPLTTYSAVPAWLSSHGHTALVEGNSYLEVDTTEQYATRLSLLTRHAAAPLATAVLRHSTPADATPPSWADLADGLRVVSGKMDRFPSWPLDGFIVGVTGGSAAVRDVVAKMSAAGVPLSAVWIQDWCGSTIATAQKRVLFDWQAGSCDYPDWWQLVAELGKVGIRVMSYVNPFLTPNSVASPCGIPRTALYTHAANAGYLVMDGDGKQPLYTHEEVVFGNGAATIDLTSSDAKAWFRDTVLRCCVLGMREYCDESSPFILPPANATPLVGFMADFGEHLPLVGARFASGVDAMEAHNEQADAFARVTHEAITGTRIDADGLAFHRSGATTTPPYVRSFWAGDQEQYWHANDGFASLPRTYISSGLAGWGAMHSDIGGMVYASVFGTRTEELLLRWLEFCAFCDPMMRSHPSEATNGTLLPQPWSNSRLLNATRTMTAIHVAMREYKRAHLDLVHTRGTPFVKHTLHCCPVDHASSSRFDALSSQLLIGTDVLLAPVLADGKRSVSLSAPPECACGGGTATRWLFLWDPSRAFAPGESATLDAPIGMPAVLLRNGSAVAAKLLAAIAKL